MSHLNFFKDLIHYLRNARMKRTFPFSVNLNNYNVLKELLMILILKVFFKWTAFNLKVFNHGIINGVR
jgi:hypothetical protein